MQNMNEFIIRTKPRRNSDSDALAAVFAYGEKDAVVELLIDCGLWCVMIYYSHINMTIIFRRRL